MMTLQKISLFLLLTCCHGIASTLQLANDRLQTSWTFSDSGAFSAKIRDFPLQGDLFIITLADGSIIKSSEMLLEGAPKVEPLPVTPKASRYSETLPGKQIVANFKSSKNDLSVTWRAVLRDGSDYLRQFVAIKAGTASLNVKEVKLFDLCITGGTSTGSVTGSPVTTGSMYFAVEHPLSNNVAGKDRLIGKLPFNSEIAAGKTFKLSNVIGFAQPGQMRRAFLTYIERERAHPYRPFLNYNTWYDIGYHNWFNESDLLATINLYNQELVEKRHVRMDSFLMDDGWDDPHTLWKPHKGFPNGFGAVAQAAAKDGGAIGLWISPWGGYSTAKKQRIDSAKEDGFEIVGESFSMAEPKYYERFRSVCIEAIQKYGTNQFKFDGLAAGRRAETEAMLQLIHELRSLKPDIYINLTSGTFPSPFWLFDADSIWRGGMDYSFAGTGSPRQKWITYRDGDVYKHVVQQGHLFPITSLMVHGIIYAKRAPDNLNTDPNHDLRTEVRSFFASGSQMQELYITPSLLTSENWDDIAQSAKWARENADVLCDSHWIGGDPNKGEAYGWASWSPRKGILALRNPSDQPNTITLDAQNTFELPDGASLQYTLFSPYKDQRVKSGRLQAGKPLSFDLEPFEVLIFDANP